MLIIFSFCSLQFLELVRVNSIARVRCLYLHLVDYHSHHNCPSTLNSSVTTHLLIKEVSGTLPWHYLRVAGIHAYFVAVNPSFVEISILLPRKGRSLGELSDPVLAL